MQEIVCYALTIYIVILFARAIISWFPISYESPMAKVRDALTMVTEPLLKPVRSLIPMASVGGVGLDLSFLLVTFGLFFVRAAVCSGI